MSKRIKILHTEASTGWGGQEIRILQESLALQKKGYEISFAVAPDSQLGAEALKKGFSVYYLPIRWSTFFYTVPKLMWIIWTHSIRIVNTHSSTDAWLGGIAAKLAWCKVIRTRHLSTPIKPGLNSKILFRTLADVTITTCQAVAKTIRKQANISSKRCRSIPTGINPKRIQVSDQDILDFCKKWNLTPEDCVIGTACILRSWKGVDHLIEAAYILRHQPHLKWLIVGTGPREVKLKRLCEKLNLTDRVIFTGFLDDPFPAISSMDVFVLLSTANEGVSQASLQAAYLQKPLITTEVGGLPEVCLNGKTGYTVDTDSPKQAARKILKLASHQSLRCKMGEQARTLVMRRFTEKHMVREIEEIYRRLRV